MSITLCIITNLTSSVKCAAVAYLASNVQHLKVLWRWNWKIVFVFQSCHTLGCIFDALFIFYRYEPEKFWKQNGIEYNAITGVIICTKKFFLKTISLYHNSVSSKQNT